MQGRGAMSETAEIFSLNNRLPTDAEIRSASEAAEAIARACARNGGSLPFTDDNGAQVALSASLCELITDVLGHVSRGEMVTVVSTGALLSTQEAADLLNVSRPFLVGLLKNGDIDYVTVGTHRRVKLNDLMEYKRNRDVQRKEALQVISDLGQEMSSS